MWSLQQIQTALKREAALSLVVHVWLQEDVEDDMLVPWRRTRGCSLS